MLVEVFSTVLGPLVLVAGLAALLGRYGRVDPKPLARVTFYLFNPSLAFVSLASMTVSPQLLGQLVLIKVLAFVVTVPAARWVAARLRLSAAASSAFTLAVIFANSGNFGLSINEYAFGKAGLTLAVISYLTDNLLVNSVGVYIAARGHASARAAAVQVFRNPALYAVFLGLAVHEIGWQAPLPLWRGLETLSRATVPTMLTVLGVQLAQLPVQRRHWRTVGVVAVLRLVVSPLIAMILVKPLGLTGLGRQVAILQTAPPTAVTASILATQYDTEPGLVASSVFVTSLLSLITVTLLLTWIM